MSALDAANGKMVKAKNDVSYWTVQAEQHPHSKKARDRLVRAENLFDTACRERREARDATI